MTDNQFCRVEREGPLTIITLNRPEVMNALHPPAHFELNKVFDDFAADPDQWVAIVTGAGDRAFSAGNDLKYQASGGKMSSPPGGFAGLTARFDLNKPLIAAVNGIAMGGGFEIALACDLIVAAETAVFALPEPRVGLAALAGGLHRLPRVIGPKRALGMILTGRRVSAKEGEALGFVNEVVAPGDLMKAAKRWAAQILELSPMSVRASKEAVYKGLDESALSGAIANQARYPAVAAMFKSADFVEGPRAFAEKRPPQWKGA
jgi:enoyl-CoA hydratase/carnithine racemase